MKCRIREIGIHTFETSDSMAADDPFRPGRPIILQPAPWPRDSSRSSTPQAEPPALSHSPPELWRALTQHIGSYSGGRPRRSPGWRAPSGSSGPEVGSGPGKCGRTAASKRMRCKAPGYKSRLLRIGAIRSRLPKGAGVVVLTMGCFSWRSATLKATRHLHWRGILRPFEGGDGPCAQSMSSYWTLVSPFES